MSKHYPGDDSRDQQMEAIAQQLPDDHRILDAAYSALIDLNKACRGLRPNRTRSYAKFIF